ncbi:MAG TPA: type II toxin-antitoxin system prevent-host-death family antitoxin [Acidobacteriota bacterium]|nr:type II toxin-antitoxin system prevent-host-death family antitoxin [Acidobacteriota bacterium]
MQEFVSKSKFKPQALEYFRNVESTGKTLIITDHGRPVLKIVPYQEDEPDEILSSLRGSVLEYRDPTEPLAEEEWEAAQ